jgi:hypothetical protein
MSAEEAERARGVVKDALFDLASIIREAAGREMAAVMHSKPLAAVTPAEAAGALANYVVEGDADLTWRAARAGVRAAVRELAPLFPGNLASELVEALRALDEGEARGLATPAEAARGKGAPARYGPLGRRAELGRWLVIETAFQVGRLSLSFDAAVGLVTEVTRDEKPSSYGSPLLPLGGAWKAVSNFINQARQSNPVMWAWAKAQGEALTRGETLDPEFTASRTEVLAIAKNDAAWRSFLRKAKVQAPRSGKP